MFNLTASGFDEMQYILENISQLPQKIQKAVEVANLEPEIKSGLLEAVKTMKITDRGIEMVDKEIKPGITANLLLKALQYGSASLNIKPQLNLKDLILE